MYVHKDLEAMPKTTQTPKGSTNKRKITSQGQFVISRFMFSRGYSTSARQNFVSGSSQKENFFAEHITIVLRGSLRYLSITSGI